MTQKSVISSNALRSRSEPQLYGADFLSTGPVPRSHDRWGETGGEQVIQDSLDPCCTAGGSTDWATPCSMSECMIYLDGDGDDGVEECTVLTSVTPPSISEAQGPHPCAPVPCPMPDTSSPICSMCSPPTSDWDTCTSPAQSPGCSYRDPVSAAAHLHLLGESLSLIGSHLQETDKMLCTSSSLSLLLDSLLCALAPIICLTAQVPELRSCTQHTLASTLENIVYVMPGL